jgi:hypothetical protein
VDGNKIWVGYFLLEVCCGSDEEIILEYFSNKQLAEQWLAEFNKLDGDDGGIKEIELDTHNPNNKVIEIFTIVYRRDLDLKEKKGCLSLHTNKVWSCSVELPIRTNNKSISGIHVVYIEVTDSTPEKAKVGLLEYLKQFPDEQLK